MRVDLHRLVLCLLLSGMIAGCASNPPSTATDKFSFTTYSTNETPISSLNAQLRKLESRQEIEGLLITQGGARKESFDDQTVFYIYESPAPVLAWAIITKVTYDQTGKPRGRTAVRDTIPHLVSPAENPKQFYIKPWLTYGDGYGKARLDTILQETFPVGTSCSNAKNTLQASGDINKVRRLPARTTSDIHVSIYKNVTLLAAGWEYGVSFTCDKGDLLRTPPVSFGRYTGI